MKSIEELEKERAELWKKDTKIRDEIDSRIEDELRPTYENKYNGKYFLYKNTSVEDNLTLYIYVKKVTDIYPSYCRMDVVKVQSYNGASEIKSSSITSNLLEVEVTKAKYDKAYNKILKEIHK